MKNIFVAFAGDALACQVLAVFSRAYDAAKYCQAYNDKFIRPGHAHMGARYESFILDGEES